MAKPIPAKPNSIIAHVAGSGTARKLNVMEPVSPPRFGAFAVNVRLSVRPAPRGTSIKLTMLLAGPDQIELPLRETFVKVKPLVVLSRIIAYNPPAEFVKFTVLENIPETPVSLKVMVSSACEQVMTPELLVQVPSDIVDALATEPTERAAKPTAAAARILIFIPKPLQHIARSLSASFLPLSASSRESG